MHKLSYISLINLENEKAVRDVFDKEYTNQKFVIQEKIHGANISFRFDNEGTMTIHSRNQKVNDLSQFNHLNTVIQDYKSVEDKIVAYLANNFAFNIESFYIFGEFFGGNIQKGVEYGEKRRILFFDIYINESIVDYKKFSKLIKEIGIEEYCVKPLAIVNSFQEALEFNHIFRSTYSPPDYVSTACINPDNICEGIVIKQYEASVYDKSLILCKKRTDSFFEAKKMKKPNRPQAKPSVKKDSIFDYINRNRIASYLSKIMDINELSDQHLEDIIEDALKDLRIDTPDFVLDDKKKESAKSKIRGIYKANF